MMVRVCKEADGFFAQIGGVVFTGGSLNVM